jgi:putative sigma-54 modulation protein
MPFTGPSGPFIKESVMKVIFTGRHVEVSDALKGFAQERLEKMIPYLDDVIDIHVILGVEKHRHQAEVSVKTRSGDFLASAETDDMYASLSQALDKLETQAHKHAGKRHAANKAIDKEKVVMVPAE